MLVFQNGVLKRMLGSKRDEIIVGWRKLHNEKLHNTNIMFLEIIYHLVPIYNIVLYIFQNTTFRRLDSVSVSLSIQPN
jgi:hypothetical protein